MPTPAPYGNYKGYAGSHSRHASLPAPAPHLPDPRLTLLHTHFPFLLPAAHILDLGSNAGRVSIDAALHFGAARVTGVELDPALVAAARRGVGEVFSRVREGRVYYPVSAVRRWGAVPAVGGAVRFVCGDVREVWGAAEVRGVGVVLALSVLKWVQLWGGDEGVVRVVEGVEGVFEGNGGEGGERTPKGYLVIEMQDWRSYEKAVGKVKELRGRLEGLRLRPEMWAEWLRGRGWELEGRLEPGGRVIEVWRWP